MTEHVIHDQHGPIEDAREGMVVLDPTGDKVGTVAEVSMGDPQAVTTAGQHLDSGEPLLNAARAAFGGGTDLPDQVRQKLLRTGYLRIDTGILGRDLYARADQVLAVSGDTVQLRVGSGGLSSAR